MPSWTRPSTSAGPAATALPSLVPAALFGTVLLMALAAPAAWPDARQGPGASGACAAHCAHGSGASCMAAASARSSPVAPGAPGQAALRAERDPESGGWTLAPLWVATSSGPEAAALNMSAEGLTFVDLPGGGVGVDLQGRFQSYSVARRTLDGQLESACMSSPSSLFLWFYGLAPSTPPAARTER